MVLTTLMALALSLLPLIGLHQISMPTRLFFFLAPCILLLGVLVALWIAARLLDRRPVADFGLSLDRHWWADLCFGLFLGALLIAAVFLLQWMAGWVEIVGWFHRGKTDEAFGTVLASLAVLFMCVGFYEEIAYRGYLLRNVAEGLNFSTLGAAGSLVVAVVLTSVLFGGVHARNPSASVPSVINTMLAGVVLGLGFLLTGKLGLPIGIHITWNFFQGPVFGYRVSGVGIGSSIFVTKKSGPELWAGGDYGPEGGLLTSGMLLVALPLMLAWIRLHYGSLSLDRSLAQPPSSAVGNAFEQCQQDEDLAESRPVESGRGEGPSA
jgi:membrane protease YdiL (CAAX protease family)